MNRSVVERARPADVSVEQELRARLESLRAMPVRTLQDTYYDTHGRATHARNREWLIRRCFVRMQETLTGVSLSDAARARIAELAEGQDVRIRPVTLPEPLPEPEPVDTPSARPA